MLLCDYSYKDMLELLILLHLIQRTVKSNKLIILYLQEILSLTKYDIIILHSFFLPS